MKFISALVLGSAGIVALSGKVNLSAISPMTLGICGVVVLALVVIVGFASTLKGN